jgi:hypothetical protein
MNTPEELKIVSGIFQGIPQHLTRTDVERLRRGDESIVAELITLVPEAERIPTEPLPCGFSSGPAPEMSTEFMRLCEAHVYAAAFGQKQLSRLLYEAGALNQRHWEQSVLEFGLTGGLVFVCPVCFGLIDGCRAADNPCGHLAYYVMSDNSCTYLSGEDSYENSLVFEFDELLEHEKFERPGKFENLKQQLFTDDPVGHSLKRAANHEQWWLHLPFGKDVRGFSVFCDVDMWGDTTFYGLHPNADYFAQELRAIEKSMKARCIELGLDLSDWE